MLQWRNHLESQSGPSRWVKITGTRAGVLGLYFGASLRSHDVCMPVYTQTHTHIHRLTYTGTRRGVVHQRCKLFLLVKDKEQSSGLRVISRLCADGLLGLSDEPAGPGGLCLHLCRLVCETDQGRLRGWRKESLTQGNRITGNKKTGSGGWELASI